MKYVKFFGSNGYYGTEYEDIQVFSDDYAEIDFDEIAKELTYNCAEDYSYLSTGWGNDFESEEEEEAYFENAVSNCGWCYVSEEEWRDAGALTEYL